MTTLATSLITWEEFLHLPDAGNGEHYELHDGEVILMPPPRPIHVYIQSLLVQWLTGAAQGHGRAAQEFPYRPARNLQFWHADVAYLPNEDWPAMRASEYPIYAPPLVIEVLSPSNQRQELERQRLAAFSGGTKEFWIVDADAPSVEVCIPGLVTRVYGAPDRIPVSVVEGAIFPVDLLLPDAI